MYIYVYIYIYIYRYIDIYIYIYGRWAQGWANPHASLQVGGLTCLASGFGSKPNSSISNSSILKPKHAFKPNLSNL